MLKRPVSFIRRSKDSGCEDIHYSCNVRFLDETEPLTVTFQKSSRGQEVIDQVCASLNLIERDYFGLRYVDSEKQRHWLDASKPAITQLKNVKPGVLCFRVKFYPSDPSKLKEEITKYYLYLQLGRDLHHGRLLCSLFEANQLAAYIVQAEVGDYDATEQSADYITLVKMLPKQCQKQDAAIQELHKQLSGQVPSEVESRFVEMASKLDTYGVDPHPVRDPSGVQKYLGVTHHGIVTFQGNKRTHLFKWPQVAKLDFEGKQFIVQVSEASEAVDSVVAAAPVKRKKPTHHHFKCPSPRACKHLWKSCVEQQFFFTLQSSMKAPKVAAGRGLFRRGSQYRFSGHCETEAFAESAGITRSAPTFTRSMSNPQIGRLNTSTGSSTLPSWFKASNLNESNVSMLESNWSSNSDNMAATFNHGDVSASAIREETPVEISELNYSPLQSPENEALPSLAPSSAAAERKPSIQSNGEGIRIPKGGDVQQSTIASVIETSAEGSASVDAREAYLTTSIDLDAQIRELQAELDKCRSLPAPVFTATGTASTGWQQHHHSQDQQQQQQTSTHATISHADPTGAPVESNGGVGNKRGASSSATAVPAASRRGNTMRSVAFAALAVLLLAIVLFVLIFETHMDVPIISSVRKLREVRRFGRLYYTPLKKSIFG